MKQIKHIVYLMLENRSLDSVLGWLYNWKVRPKHVIPKDSGSLFNGLKPEGYFNLDRNGGRHYATPITGTSMQIPPKDPHEVYAHVNFQLFQSSSNPSPYTVPSMGGFYRDYASILVNADPIMQSYTPKTLPVLNGLAGQFAVSDAYYCSVPTQTNCNRAFAATGSSLGHYYKTPHVLEAWVDNHWGTFEVWDLDVTFSQPTIWEVLDKNGHSTTDDWMVFYSHIWPFEHPGGYCFTRDLFPALQTSAYDAHFKSMDSFFDKVKNNQLPAFSFLEPSWFLEKFGIGSNGTDYHPPANLCPGEQFLHKIYDALSSNPEVWNSTLFIINFDEHGGTYDHMPPPWGAKTPWNNPVDGTPKPAKCEEGFGFDRFGVRVPLILVSPYIEESTVFRAPTGQDTKSHPPLDHCSIIATVLNHFQVPKTNWQMGSRVANAPTIDHVLTRDTPRKAPIITPRSCSGDTQDIYQDANDAPASDLQRMIAQRVLMQFGKQKGLDRQQIQMVFQDHFTDSLETVSDLCGAIQAGVDSMSPE